MKTIVVTSARYMNNNDSIVEILYRGTHWEFTPVRGSAPVLDVYNQSDKIATLKSWDHVHFSDQLVEEKTRI